MALHLSTFSRRLIIAMLAAVASSALALSAAEPQKALLSTGGTRITISGTSNIHAWTASTTAAQLTRVDLSPGLTAANALATLSNPGQVSAFAISVPASSLHSERDGLDKNMWKALKADKHPDITFALARIEPRAGIEGGLRAIGTLQVAGVEREVALDLVAVQREEALSVRGEVALVMTDFGIAPPRAMLGMLRTDPKVSVQFETVVTLIQN
jgi:polyisoprenoid-binding protein YceI